MATKFYLVDALVFKGLTTAERDALNAQENMFILNAETGQYETYIGGVWRGVPILNTDGQVSSSQHGSHADDLHPPYANIASPEEITTGWLLKSGATLRPMAGDPPEGEIGIQRKTSVGAPTHSAGLGTLCWVEPDDYIYVNNDGDVGWTKQAKYGDLHTEIHVHDSIVIPGMDGEDGQDGNPGIDGPPGLAGATGSTGATGASGPEGPPGTDGLDGSDGAPGTDGADGADGSTGATGPSGSTGPPGTPGVDGEDGSPGPPGEDGSDGATGSTGSTGATGEAGSSGPIGPPGEAGEEGQQGPPGLPGTQHVYRYVNVPDAAPGETVVAGDAQGLHHLSGPVAEKAYKLHVLAKTAPGASGLPVTWQYNSSDDLDTESWTTIATYTLSSEKSNSTEGMTNAIIPANRLIRVNWGTIVGSPADAQTILLTRPVA